MRRLWTDGKIVVYEKVAGVSMSEIYKEIEFEKENVYYRDSEEMVEFFQRRGIAHRLDKETSGCLLAANDPKTLKFLMDQFRRRLIKKEYVALVHGRLEPGEGEVRLPLRRSKSERLKREVGYDGKMAQTSWKVERYFKNYSLVRLWPLTGRMHQIRVHLSHLGHPLFGESKYQSQSRAGEDRKMLNHHFLHAEKIGFSDLSGKWITVVCDLQEDMVALLSMLE